MERCNSILKMHLTETMCSVNPPLLKAFNQNSNNLWSIFFETKPESLPVTSVRSPKIQGSPICYPFQSLCICNAMRKPNSYTSHRLFPHRSPKTSLLRKYCHWTNLSACWKKIHACNKVISQRISSAASVCTRNATGVIHANWIMQTEFMQTEYWKTLSQPK